jgi:hypothetical protein
MEIFLPWRQPRNGSNDNNNNMNNNNIPGEAGMVDGREGGMRGMRGNGNNNGNNNAVNMNDNDNNNQGNQGAAQQEQGGHQEGGGGFFNNLLDAPNFFRRNENIMQQRHQQQAMDRDLPVPGVGAAAMNPHEFNKYYQQDDTGSSPLSKVLDELNMSILPHDVRLAAVHKASQLFDHRDRIKHDYELHEGAAKILYQKLAFVLTLCVQTFDEQSHGIDVYSSSGSRSYDTTSAYNMLAGGRGGGTGPGNLAGALAGNDNEASAATAMNSSAHSIHNAHGRGRLHSNTHHAHAHAHAHAHTHAHGHGHGHATNANTSIASMQRMRSTRSNYASDADYEIAILTACLEMVHRASNSSIALTWHTIGIEALAILVKLLERPFDKIQSILDQASKNNLSANVIDRNLSQAINRENKLSVQKITKILAVYSLIPEAKAVMARCPGLLSVLVKITDTQNINRMKTMRPVSNRIKKCMMHASASANGFHVNVRPHSDATSASASGANGINGTTAGAGLYMTEAARFNAIAVLTNLAAVEQNRMLMLSEPGLVNNIARVVHNERSDVARQCSSLAIMNLSNGDREHVPELAGNDLILETIIKLMKDDDLETRRNAAISLFNVACADENTVKLVRYKDGIILEVLMQCLSSDEDDQNEINNDVRMNAAEALFNMACSSIEETTDRMASHAGLMETLALVLKGPMGCKEVKLYCAATLRRMAEIIHAPKRSQLELLSALVKAHVWTRTPCIAEAFLTQAQEERNRHVMVEHNGLLNALSKLALAMGGADSEKIRFTTVSAIEHLSRDEENREILGQHEGIMLAMTRASYIPDDDGESIATSPSIVANRRVQLALKHLVSAM